MPIVRKLMKVGVDSKAITLPKSWVQNAEQVSGKKIVAIAMEVDGSITLNPVFEKLEASAPALGSQDAPAPANPTFSGGKAN